MFRGVGWRLLRAAAGTLVFLSNPSDAAANSPISFVPRLLPGEVYLETANGCGLIEWAENVKTRFETVEAAKTAYSNSTWTGLCPYGLATGSGTIGDRSYQEDFLDGRTLGTAVHPRSSETKSRRRISLPGQGRLVQYGTVANPFEAVWQSHDAGFLHGLNDISIRTFVECDGSKTGCYAREQSFGVALEPGRSGNAEEKIYCPNPRQLKGCEKLWYQMSAPIAAQIKAFQAEHHQYIAERTREVAPWVAEWKANWPEASSRRSALLAIKRKQSLLKQSSDLAEILYVCGTHIDRALEHKRAKGYDAKGARSALIADMWNLMSYDRSNIAVTMNAIPSLMKLPFYPCAVARRLKQLAIP